MNILQQRVRLGARIVAILSLLRFFIIAQDKGKLEIINCLTTDSLPIYVSSVYLTCDSAGAYYYGKSSYRNSTTCKYGDTAYLNAFLELQRDFENDGVMISVDAGVYGVLSSAMDTSDFCEMSELSTSTSASYADTATNAKYDDDDDGYAAAAASDDDVAAVDDDAAAYASADCPTSGFYHWKAYFTVSSFQVDQNFHYTPDLRLTFYNATSMAVVGCAETGTMATYDHATMHAEMGMMALGIGLLVLGTCFGIMLYLTYRRKKRMEQEMKDDKRLLQEIPYVRTTTRGRMNIPWDVTTKQRSDRSSRGSSDCN